ESDRLAVARPLPGLRELRHDLEVGRDIDKLVAECCEHEAAGIGAAERGVQRIGVVLDTNPQRRGLGRNQSQCRHRNCRQHRSYAPHMGLPSLLPSADKTSTPDSICKYCEQTNPNFVERPSKGVPYRPRSPLDDI